MLDVNDSLMGSQIQQLNRLFMGATWGTNDSSITLMFGGAGSGPAHPTRHITDLTFPHILQDKDGRDVALSIGHGLSQTIATFHEGDGDF